MADLGIFPRRSLSAEGAEWVGCGKRVSPFPTGEGSGEEAVPTTQEKN